MIETSLGITAAAHFTPLLDYVDLDGAALLAQDPFAGATIDGRPRRASHRSGARRHEAMTPRRIVRAARRTLGGWREPLTAR